MIKLLTSEAALEICKKGSEFGDFMLNTYAKKQKLDQFAFNAIISAADSKRDDGDVFRTDLLQFLYQNMGENIWSVLEV